ncbi:NUDIX domain-containing protein [Kitasatospora sp. HPMI-4]|uniref:NUDIX domain-containing protein n=1 Tax=Kitasatospora sp. HPMI-4 TaxID=3448443 RepID=UPI003F1DC990
MNETARPDPELARYLAEHAAPAACSDALIRDHHGNVLVVDPVYKQGWDLPGGMLEDEEPAAGLVRELAEELGLHAEVGRLLAVDTAPATRWGRTVVSYLYAAHLERPVDAADLVLQADEIREARFVTEQRALELLAPAVARRLDAAIAAERGAHTAVLRDGHRRPMPPRDYYRQLPAPMMAATVLLRDTAGHLLVLEPAYKDHLELPGGMVEAHETPAQAAARELDEELGLDVPVGRLLVVDSTPAALSKHGRALTCHIYDAVPLTADQARGLRFVDGEIRAAHWMDPKEAEERLPWYLSSRVAAAREALADGTLVHIERSPAEDSPQASGRTSPEALSDRR